MFLRLAYIALIAASIALRLAFAYPQASASDLVRTAGRSGSASPMQAGSGTQEFDSAPLITGRSVAAPTSQPGHEVEAVERRLHDGLGAAGFARR
jgi:hypothetical protein